MLLTKGRPENVSDVLLLLSLHWCLYPQAYSPDGDDERFHAGHSSGTRSPGNKCHTGAQSTGRMSALEKALNDKK